MHAVRIGNRHITLQPMIDPDLAMIRRKRRAFELAHSLVSFVAATSFIAAITAGLIVYGG